MYSMIKRHVYSVAAVVLVMFGCTKLRSRTTRYILVTYAYSQIDEFSEANLLFFIDFAIRNDPISRYYIIIQSDSPNYYNSLPALPAHAKYVHHANRCYDWGAYGWILNSGMVNIHMYRYFIFINSSVRGPFLPTYTPPSMRWTDPFTMKLVGNIKQVGPTISCEGSPLKGNVNAHWRKTPHVQSYAFSTDLAGLSIMIGDPDIFACHDDRWDAIYFSELGSAVKLFESGFSICFMLRYQNVDWMTYKSCNYEINPLGLLANDGTTLDPLEVMFVKFKNATASTSHLASKYTDWMRRSDERKIA